MKWIQVGMLTAVGAAVLAAQAKVPADEWNDKGLAASARFDYVEAERDLGESIRLWQEMGPQYEGHTAVVMMNLAEALCGQGKWRQGASLLTKSLEVSRRALGNRHLRTVSNLNFLAGADMILGELETAAALYREALGVERELYPATTQLADTLMGLSSYYARENRMAEALPPAEEGLQVALAAGGEMTLDSAMAYANVAQIHAFSHRPDRAIPLFTKAEAIYAKVLSPDHPRYASVLSQEGLALMDDHKLALANRNMVRAVQILSNCAGCQYQQAVAVSNLGWLRYQEGKYGEADTLLSQALVLQESYASQPGSEMAATLNRLADVRRKERKYSDAEQLHNRALTLQSYR
ncbi:MAG TPA: tetratricopeptide repeat protein [Candidatus Sulfopaludibacter sp.]|jgi:tetratricopeptide (TPR) repeat protein|nr:tetratricopeptide repeat protein [Candidatus Sulfopaludibacter sp.]